MNWKPVFIKSFGFFSPVNNHAKIVAWIYRLTFPIMLVVLYATEFSSRSKLIIATGAVVFTTILYYSYASKCVQNVKAR